MMEFIQKYWVEVFFSGVLSIFGWMLKQMLSKVKRYEHLGDGVKALLYDRMRQSYNYHMEKGFVTIDDYNYFNNLYSAYKHLGGNGSGDEMVNRLKDLPPNPLKDVPQNICCGAKNN